MRQNLPDIMLSLTDFDRLEALLHSLPPTDPARQGQSGTLSYELERAMLCHASEMPPDVVTLHSRLTVRLGQRESKLLTLVLPDELQPDAVDQVSVLAPVGTAILGLQAGSSVLWPMPNGILQQIEVLTLHFQPERDLAGQQTKRDGVLPQQNRNDSSGKMRLLPL